MIRKLLPVFPNSRSLLIVLAVLTVFAVSVFMAFSILLWGTTGAALIVVALVMPLSVFMILKYPKFGVLAYISLAYWIMFILNVGINFPLGTVMDAILLLLIIGFFIEQKKDKNWKIFKNPVTTIVIIWVLYNILQLINPETASRLAWVYTIRAIAGVTISYFIFSYHINSVKFLRLIIKFWLIFSVFAALYAVKQEYFGFFDFEQRALDADKKLQSLLFINGHWRKSSIFADPVSFSYNMVVSSIFCIVLMFGPTSKRMKIVLGLMVVLFLNVMLYSGTRAAYVLLPAAMALLTVLKFNKPILIFSISFGVFFFVLTRIPTSNPSLVRFQSAFKPSDDASYTVRVVNQQRIKPYIKSHPLGGGLGSTGASGSKFSPNTFLAQFPPDSGFVRAAVEQGWVGLMLLCALFFIPLKTGINNYFLIKDPELKTYCLGMVLMLFALCVGNFPQEGIIQFPLNIYFYLFIALINITYRLDQEKQAGEALS